MKKETKKKSLRRVSVFILFLFFGAVNLAPAQAFLYKSTPFKDGEVLRYKVKWGFIRVGTVEISQRIIEPSYPPWYLVQMRAKSTKFKVVLHADSPTNSRFVLERGKEKQTKTVYRYDSQQNLILMESWENGNLLHRTSLLYEDAYYDVLGLIMMMRCLLDSGASVTLPTIVDSGVKGTDLNFTDRVKKIKVSAFERPVRARQVEGMANWKAWAGLSGPFEGWFSDDEAAIPLKIRIRVSLGSITLELERVHRPDWPGIDESPKLIENSTKEVSRQ